MILKSVFVSNGHFDNNIIQLALLNDEMQQTHQTIDGAISYSMGQR